MEYQNFITIIKEELEHISQKEVHLDRQSKNNDVIVDSLTIRDPAFNIAPTIYLTPYYARHLDGMSIQEIVRDIYDTYEQAAPVSDFDVTQYTDYQKAQKSICMRLVNFEKNRERLRDLPHVRFHDLAIIFAYILPIEDKGYGAIVVHRNHLALWNVTVEDLYAKAMENSPHILPVQIDTMDALMKRLCPEFVFPDDPQPQMLVMSNSRSVYGAATILYPNVLKHLSDRYEKDLFIIPSSIHEVIVLPDESYDPEELSQLICDVNEMELEDTDILSDHPYYYSRQTDEILMHP